MALDTYFDELLAAIDDIPSNLSHNPQAHTIRSYLEKLSSEGSLKTFARVDDMLDICHVFSLIAKHKNPTMYQYLSQVITALWDYIREWVELYQQGHISADPHAPLSQFEALMANELLDASPLSNILKAHHRLAAEFLISQPQFSDFEDNLAYYGLWVEHYASLQVDLLKKAQEDATFNPSEALQTYLTLTHQLECSDPSEDLSTQLGCSENTRNLFNEVQALKKNHKRAPKHEEQPKPAATQYTLTSAGLISFIDRTRLLQVHEQKIDAFIQALPATVSRQMKGVFNHNSKYNEKYSNNELIIKALLKIMNVHYLKSNPSIRHDFDITVNKLRTELWSHAAMIPNTDDHEEVFFPQLIGSICAPYTPSHIPHEHQDLFPKAYLCTQPLVDMQVKLLKSASECVDRSSLTLKQNQKQRYGLCIALADQLLTLQCALINDALRHPELVTLTYPKNHTFELKAPEELGKNLLWQYSTLIANTIGSMLNIPSSTKTPSSKEIIGHPHHALFSQVTRETLGSTLLQAAVIGLVITGIAVASLSVTYWAGSHTSLEILSTTFHHSIAAVLILFMGSVGTCSLCGIAYQGYHFKAPLLTPHTGIHPLEYKASMNAAKQLKTI